MDKAAFRKAMAEAVREEFDALDDAALEAQLKAMAREVRDRLDR